MNLDPTSRELTEPKIATVDFGSNKRKAEHKANKQHHKNCDHDDHIAMSNNGVPRRNKAGNKLGLGKRSLLQ